jgi:hypothetical protein
MNITIPEVKLFSPTQTIENRLFINAFSTAALPADVSSATTLVC